MVTLMSPITYTIPVATNDIFKIILNENYNLLSSYALLFSGNDLQQIVLYSSCIPLLFYLLSH